MAFIAVVLPSPGEMRRTGTFGLNVARNREERSCRRSSMSGMGRRRGFGWPRQGKVVLELACDSSRDQLWRSGCVGFGVGLASNQGAMEAEAEVSYRIQEVAERANVPEGFVRRLIAVGALPGEEAGSGPGRSGGRGCCIPGRRRGSRSRPSSRWSIGAPCRSRSWTRR